MAEQKKVQEQDVNQLRQVRREKLADLQASGNDPFVITKYDVTHHSMDIKDHFEEMEGKDVAIAGRIMSKRVMGKASFCNVQDLQGNIQSYVARDNIGEEAYKAFKKMDIGDIVGIKGDVFRTKMGEISIHAQEVTLLSKSLQILPEKFHGLTNTDLRYRQRYVDLIMNPDVKDTFIKRSKILSAIRKYLDGQGFMEVETPILVSNAGGAAARPFETHFNALNEDFKLRISLELYLKRLIVGGMERVYEIGRIFRNEGMDATHNPEFTMIEVYQAYADFHDIMDLTEGIIQHAAKAVKGDGPVNYQGTEIKINEPFKRIHMVDAIKEITGVDFWQDMTFEEAVALANEKHVPVEKHYTEVGQIINAFFEEFVEETLTQPTFVYGHPVAVSPLAKKNPEDPRFTDRFELFIMTKEYGNAYSELNDPIDQLSRFEAQAAAKELGDDEATGIDYDYVEALEYGMPPTGGLGIGIDRLCMLLTDTTTIRDVLLFPTMK